MVKPGILSPVRVAAATSAVALLALASACSSSGKSSSSSGTSGTTGMTGTSSATVNSANASVSGQQAMVLTAPDGHTLYYFTPDTAGGQPTCTGSCAATWPGLKAASPTATSAAKGTLTVVSGQVAYNGHPLYEYSGDSAAGQANGEGIGGKWYVATPTLATGAGAPTTMPSSPPTSSGGGGNY
jgi:predicted lipoprotein with Yx(FWY)xxD motif